MKPNCFLKVFETVSETQLMEGKEAQPEEDSFERLLGDDGESQGSQSTVRTWPPLPPGYKLPDEPHDLKCSSFLELWGQCAGTAWLWFSLPFYFLFFFVSLFIHFSSCSPPCHRSCNAAPSWWLRNYYRDGTVGFNCTERWENLRTCALLKFKDYEVAEVRAPWTLPGCGACS